MRYGRVSVLVVLAVTSLAGCGEPPGPTPDQSAVETKSGALTGSAITIRNYQTGLCLGVTGGSPNWGSAMTVWGCDQSANQSFQLRALPSVPSPYVEIADWVADDRCLGGYGNGYNVNIDKCFNSDQNINDPQDAWKLTAVGTDVHNAPCYNIELEDTAGEVMGVSKGSTSPGASVITWSNFHDLTNHPDQAWCFYSSTF